MLTLKSKLRPQTIQQPVASVAPAPVCSSVVSQTPQSEAEIRIKLMPIIEKIYDDIKTMYKKLIECLENALMSSCKGTGKKPFAWNYEFGLKKNKLKIKTLGDIFIATALARLARISLNIRFDDGDTEATLSYRTQAPAACSSPSSQLYVMTAPSAYPKVVDKLKTEALFRQAETVKQIKTVAPDLFEGVGDDASWSLMITAGEIWDVLLSKKTNTKPSSAEVTLLNIWAIAETYRDPAMLVFCKRSRIPVRQEKSN